MLLIHVLGRRSAIPVGASSQAFPVRGESTGDAGVDVQHPAIPDVTSGNVEDSSLHLLCAPVEPVPRGH
eukprot:8929889-Karenia_brevis.AAC.1